MSNRLMTLWLRMMPMAAAAVMLLAAAHRAHAASVLSFKGNTVAGATRYWLDTDSGVEGSATYVAPSAGKICDLVARCETAITGSHTITLRKNAASTALTATITDTTEAADHNALHCVTVAEGDLIALQSTGSGSVAACKAVVNVVNADGSAHHGWQPFGLSASVTPTDGNWCGPGAASNAMGCGSTTEGRGAIVVPVDTVLTKLAVHVSVNVTGFDETYTVRNLTDACDYNMVARVDVASNTVVGTCASGSGAQCATCDAAGGERIILRANKCTDDATPCTTGGTFQAARRSFVLEHTGPSWFGFDAASTGSTNYWAWLRPATPPTKAAAAWPMPVAVRAQNLRVTRTTACAADTLTWRICGDDANADPTCTGDPSGTMAPTVATVYVATSLDIAQGGSLVIEGTACNAIQSETMAWLELAEQGAVNTFTPTPTFTLTDTPTRTPTETFTSTPTRTPTETRTHTPTQPSDDTHTPTRTPTNTGTATFTPTETHTPTRTPTNTQPPPPTGCSILGGPVLVPSATPTEVP